MEAQQEEATAANTSGKPRLTRQAADRQREQGNLLLALKRIADQLRSSQNSQHRQMLEQAKSDLEEKIAKLNS